MIKKISLSFLFIFLFTSLGLSAQNYSLLVLKYAYMDDPYNPVPIDYEEVDNQWAVVDLKEKYIAFYDKEGKIKENVQHFEIDSYEMKQNKEPAYTEISGKTKPTSIGLQNTFILTLAKDENHYDSLEIIGASGLDSYHYLGKVVDLDK